MTTCIDCGKPVSAKHVKRCQECYHKSRVGVPHSEEWTQKIAKALRERERTPEETAQSIANLSKAWEMERGPVSQETKDKMRKAAIKRERAHIEALHASNVKNGHYYPLGAAVFNKKSGYVMVKVQHFNRQRNWRMQHRVVMEQHLGRPLARNEWIHHIDGDKTNNDLSNLALLTPKEHFVLNQLLAKINERPEFRDVVIRTLMQRVPGLDLQK
jgi:hypothetical protein